MQSGSLASTAPATEHPVVVTVVPQVMHRNRLTCAFRPILALPHILLVGGPVAFALSVAAPGDGKPGFEWGGGGVLGAVALVCAIIAWFAIVFGFRAPPGLRNLVTLYLRWRVRAVAYLALLRDDYPPFGEGEYPATLRLPEPEEPRDRLTVAFRLVLALPHLLVIWLLGIAWVITTIIAWFSILFTANYPRSLYRFATGMLQWNARVEAYVLLLHDEYPPFSLD